MVRNPVRFERVAAAFEVEAARVTTARLCESSGSDHSPEISLDLTALVKSFMEREEARGFENQLEMDDRWSDSEEDNEMLQSLLMGDQSEDDGEDAKKKIAGEVEIASSLVGGKSSPEFKRRLMTRLRQRGFDAGLCKSKWDKKGRIPGGEFEYVDVNFAGKRYIVEVSICAEFQIARPTEKFTSLVDAFPLIYVGKAEELKRVVRFMCNAIEESMKSMELHVPPWRRNGYMQAKWFSSYRRTTNEVSTSRKASSSVLSSQTFSASKSLGFLARPVGGVRSYKDHDEYVNNVSKIGLRVGHLTAALNS